MTLDAQFFRPFALKATDQYPERNLPGNRRQRAAIWARIEELRALGYDIEASPHQGYRLLDSPMSSTPTICWHDWKNSRGWREIQFF